MNLFLDDIIDSSGVLHELECPRSFDPAVASPYSIEVFIEWNNCIATMVYPSQESKWRKRSDCGSHSQHRWSLYDDDKELVQLVVKHNSCEKALGFQPYCRHCENKASWRQPCLTPQNVFYILRVTGTIDDCQKSIESLIHSKRFLEDTATITSYQRSKPRVAWDHKDVNLSKRARFDKLEKDIEEMVVRQNMACVEEKLSEFFTPEKEEDVQKSLLDADDAATHDEGDVSFGAVADIDLKELFESYELQEQNNQISFSESWHFADDLAPPGVRFVFESTEGTVRNSVM